MAGSTVLGNSAGRENGQLPAALDLCHGRGSAVRAQTPPPGRWVLVVSAGQRLVEGSKHKQESSTISPALFSFPVHLKLM